MYYRIERLCNEISDIHNELKPFEDEKVDKDILKDVHKSINNFKVTLKDISKKKSDDEFELKYLIPACSEALKEIQFDTKENDADFLIDSLMDAAIKLGYYQELLNEKYNIRDEE